MDQQDIHDLAKKLIDDQAYYNKMYANFARMAVLMSDAAKSSKRCLKILKRECKKRRKDEN